MMTRAISTVLTVFLVMLFAPSPLRAQDFETAATAAWVYDQTTGTVLLSKNADTPLPPASMSKLMTIYIAFEAVANGTLQIDQELPVSEHAMSYDGSSMFLNTNDRVKVEDLLRGVIVLSGNDASVVLAEALSPDGTEAGFARMATERAAQLGMTHSTFVNANGWPAEGHRMSMHDLGILADHIIRDFPTFYPIFSEQEFLFDGRVPSNTQNRNPVLGMNVGADGLKTGHTEEAGFGLVGSAKQGDRRIIFVITGLPTAEARHDEAERIINWAFRQYALRSVGDEGTQLAEAPVWMGASPTVGLTLADDLSLLLPALVTGSIDAQVVYDGPIEAPITAGQQLAELVISPDGLPEMRVPLVAAASVERGGFRVRLESAVGVLLTKFGATGAVTETGTDIAPAADDAAGGA